MRLTLLFAALLLVQGSAVAQERPLSHLDAFYSYSKFSVDGVDGSSEDNGFGARAWIGKSWPIVTLEYSASDFEGDVGTGDVESLRGGAGVRLFETEQLSAWVRAEYLTFDVDLGSASLLDDEGLGVHVGIGARADSFGGYFEAGGLENTDSGGSQFTIGATYDPSNWGLFFEYRQIKLELEQFVGEPNVKFGDFRAGMRWLF